MVLANALTSSAHTAAVREDDQQIHQDEHQVVVPAVSFLSPESGVPGEDSLLDRSQRRINPKAASCVSTPMATPKAPATSAIPRTIVKPFDIPTLFERVSGSFGWV